MEGAVGIMLIEILGLGDEASAVIGQAGVVHHDGGGVGFHLLGYKVTERDIEIGELVKAYDEGKFDEAFGSGTAAVISPIGELKYGDKHMVINNGKIGPISQKLYDTLTGIQWGRLPDEFGWTVKID